MSRSISRTFGASIASIVLAGGIAALSGCATTAGHPVQTTAAATTGHPQGEATGQAAEDSQALANKARDAAAQEAAPGATAPPVEVAQEIPDETEATEETEPSPLDELPENGPQVAPGDLEHGKDLAKSAAVGFDIPMVLNDRVAAYVEYFTNAHRGLFEASLERSVQYLEPFQSIFASAGIPKDLVYMAHVESAFKTNAYSRAQAKGIFQFISETGRRYGLRIDTWVDERSDPQKSAQAAAAYLKDLYGMFGDWYLALAAYNAGEGKVQKALSITKKSDFWELCSSRQLRRETKEYVPAILAAALIAKDPTKFGFTIEPVEPVAFDTVRIEGQTDLRILARLAGTDADTLRRLNPQLRKGMTPPSGTTDVKVPAGSGGATREAWAALPKADRMILARHQVSKGESLGAIAKAYGVSSSSLQRANGLTAKSALKPGQEIVVPAVAETSDGDVDRTHAVRDRVQRGDTLSSISRRFRVSVTSIAAANGKGADATIVVGQRLKIPANARSAAPATARAAGGGASAMASKSRATTKAPAPNRPLMHTVRAGETLTAIAGRYAITVDEICALNKIPADGVLYPGTHLKIRAN